MRTRNEIRDAFAAAALPALITVFDVDPPGSCKIEDLVEMSYDFADAMMKERSKSD